MYALSIPFRAAQLSCLALSLLVLLSSCAAPAGRAIEDLAAIHDPRDWSPRSPATLSVPPETYLAERPMRGGGPGRYVIDDHRELELAILRSLATAPYNDQGMALEASAWLAVELLYDDYDEARAKSAAVLSSLAAAWIERLAVRVPIAQATDGETYARATQAFLDADERGNDADRAAALDTLIGLRAPSSTVSVRTLTGVARRLSRAPLPPRFEQRGFAFGLTCVLGFLEEGAQDPSPTVAEACAARLDLLSKFAHAESSSL